MQLAQFQTNYDTEVVHWWFAARRHILGVLARQLVPPSPEALVVDVGCGTGSNINSFSRDYRCMGIDPTPEAIELAGQRFPEVELICGEAPEALPDQAREARLFLLNDVLEHVHGDRDLLRRLVEFARPGSYFLVTVPAYMSLWSPHDVSHRHFRRYTRSEFQDLWADLPVDTLMVSHFNTRLYPIIRAIRIINSLRGKASGHAGTDVYVPVGPLNRLLYWLFSGEKHRLLRLLQGRTRRAYPFGVSILAVLRRR